MKKMLLLILVLTLAAPAFVYAQEAEQSKEPWAWTNGLGYGKQFQQNIDRGSKEIVNAPQQIQPSFQEYQHTKCDYPGADQFFAGVLALTNVTDSVCRGIWRIIVAPFPIGQKIQP